MDLDFVNLSMLSDVEVAAHMRKMNYEKFKTLVRMHLSFELELNTDEFDLPCHEIVYEDKGKVKKWSRLSKKHKFTTSGATAGCGTSVKGSASTENSPVDSSHQQINTGFLLHLEEIKDFLLLEKNLNQEGIFRKTGSVSRQNELRQQIQQDKPLNLTAGDYSAHDCATVFKGYLADLPEPLLTDAHYPAHLQIAPLCIGRTSTNAFINANNLTRPINPERMKRDQHLLNSVQLLVLLLPIEHRNLLVDIIELLHAVAAHENANKMSPDNLATIFAPHLICPRNLPPEALHFLSKKLSSIIAYMICKGQEIFEMPAKLSTDIRAYFHERKRKKTMSPEQTLDESISDISTVNTIYTFVDREKTAAAHTTNTTDTELAQLYAHIQSLPESSKKRRLIKQFNKQNGQGTPLQLVVMNRLKSTHSDAARSAKSIGDSIKKHIFHKGIMSRTPKRTVTATATPSGVGTETPNCANTKNPKLRVLFRSPAPCQVNASAFFGSTTPSHTSVTQSLPTTNCPNVTNTSNSIKKFNYHPLQKSISSRTLLLNSSASIRKKVSLGNNEIESYSVSSTSGDGISQALSTDIGNNNYNCSVSAPVSRQASNESSGSLSVASAAAESLNNFPLFDPNCYVTPLKLITETAKQLIGLADTGGCERKTVAWDEDNFLEVEEISNTCTPIQHSSSELKSRYKSEPNLSCTTTITSAATRDSAVKYTTGSRSLTRKLIKGVSMSNLRFPFSTPESTKRLVRSVSSTLRRCSNESQQLATDTLRATNRLIEQNITSHRAPTIPDSLEDLDDETFEENANDHLDSDSNIDDDNDDIGVSSFLKDKRSAAILDTLDEGKTHNSSCDSNSNSNSNFINETPRGNGVMMYQQLLLQQSGVYKNLELMTSTPSLLMGRRSMSPITKSTQRMPKAMQESIMTPRSRKPVMVLTATALSSSDQNQTVCQTDCSNFHEQDEDESSTQSTDENDAISPKTQLFTSPHLQFEDATSIDSYTDILQRRMVTTESSNKYSTIAFTNGPNEYTNTTKCDALSSNFKEYLLSRSVLTASPADSSFSSQPDDFGSPPKIEDLNDSQLSPSLLYCLDGNEPDEHDEKLKSNEIDSGTTAKPLATSTSQTADIAGKGSSSTRTGFHNQQVQNMYLVQTNNARKRAATNDLEKIVISPLNAAKSKTADSNTDSAATSVRHKLQLQANKENFERIEGYLRSRKLLISEYPGETSF